MNDFKTHCKKIIPAFLLAAALLFLLLIYGPCEQYFTNVYDFSFDVYDLLAMFGPLFLVLIAVAFFALLLTKEISGKLTIAIELCLLTALMAFYIQGTFFSATLPVIDGHVIDWKEYSYMRGQSILIWLLSATVSVILFLALKNERFPKLIAYVGGFGIAFLVLSSVLAGMSGDGFINKDDVVISNEHINELSEEQNFVIILLDAVDADAFYEVINDNPELKETFDGFTFFKNTVGSYQFTAYAIPMILSGEKYLCNGNYYQYLKSVYSESPLFEHLDKEEYAINLYFQDLPKVYDWISRFNNVTVDNHIAGFVYPVNFMKTMLKLSGMKYFPYDLKRFCNVTPVSIMGDSEKRSSMELSWNSDLKAFDDLIIHSSFSADNKKNFSFIYLDGAHVPFDTLQDLSKSDFATYQDEIKASIRVCSDYLNALKSCDAFDNTAVVIMADHGFPWNEKTGRQNPLLLGKGVNEKGSITFSDLPLSHEDLMRGFGSLLDGKRAEEAFQTNDEREGRLYYASEDSLGVSSFKEYIQCGYADDLTTIQPTGVEYAFK